MYLIDFTYIVSNNMMVSFVFVFLISQPPVFISYFYVAILLLYLCMATLYLI